MESERWKKEKDEIADSIPIIRTRLGALIRTHVPFPEKIDKRKIIEQVSGSNLVDYVKVKSRALPFVEITRRLSPTQLACKTTTENGDLEVLILCPAYPFDNWQGENKQRDVDFNLVISDLDYGIELREDKAFINGDEESGEIKLAQVKMLNEFLNLIEDPTKTKYLPTPHAFFD